MPFDLFSSHMTVCNCVGVNDRSSPRCSTVRRRLFLRLFPSFRRIGIFILRWVRCTVFSPIETYVEMKISQCERNKTPTVSIQFWSSQSTYFRTFSVRLPSSSDDSVSSSLSDSELSGFSYCSSRSSKNDRSRVTFNKRRWLDRSASWKNSFS